MHKIGHYLEMYNFSLKFVFHNENACDTKIEYLIFQFYNLFFDYPTTLCTISKVNQTHAIAQMSYPHE